ASDAQIKKVAADAGMDAKTTKDQMAGFIFPTAAEQKSKYFGANGIAVDAAESLGLVFKKAGSWNVDKKIAKVITGEYLD
ncbi:MAG: taurine ABC transporter substrate-binding protein, partial [Candidatus Puniceispirillum sp.]